MAEDSGQWPPAVLLADGYGGLGAARALGRRGIDVTIICTRRRRPAWYTRYARRRILVDGGDTVSARHSQLLAVLQALPVERAVLLCSSDEMVEFIATHETELRPKFAFNVPAGDLLRALNDKRSETRLMESHGIAIPETVQELPPAPEALLERLRLPIIIKPALYLSRDRFPHKNIVLNDAAQLARFYRDWRELLPEFIAQEVVPGPVSACWICSCTFDQSHRLLDCGMKQKLRAYPPQFGVSSLAISRTRPAVLDIARRFGLAVSYVGHASIEFRWDERDGQYRYIEVNPRLPANVGFEEACGLATVWNSYQVALHGYATGHPPQGTEPQVLPPAVVSPQRDGVYFLDFWADYFGQAEQGRGKAAALAATVQYLLRPSSGQFWDWRDPLPAVVVCWKVLAGKLGKPR